MPIVGNVKDGNWKLVPVPKTAVDRGVTMADETKSSDTLTTTTGPLEPSGLIGPTGPTGLESTSPTKRPSSPKRSKSKARKV